VSRERAIVTGMLGAALVAVLLIVFWPDGHHHTPKGDLDHAKDCWVHPDKQGRRHCASS
jgi:hypothetical protein